MGIPYAEVIGDPIVQSKSPLIHKFWLAKLGIEGDYRVTRVAADELPAFLATRRADPDWRGCNLTMPLKETAISLVDADDGKASRLGALNTIEPRGGMLIGRNTDLDGMIEALALARVQGRTAAVVGAGGAARAVCLALAMSSFEMVVLNRDVDRARRTVAALGIEAEATGLDRPLPPVDLLVNASALGMTGHPAFAFPLDPLPPGSAVIDIVTSPVETELLRAARARGLRTVDGLAMLIGQAAAAFRFFFGRPAPRECDAALRQRLTS